MTKHTPGPWGVRIGGDAYTVEDADSLPVAWVTRRRDKPETRLNACLMGSAPDLLAALKDLLDHTCGTDSFCEWCERHAPKDQEGSIVGPIPHVSDCLRLAAERAIDKAEGRG